MCERRRNRNWKAKRRNYLQLILFSEEKLSSRRERKWKILSRFSYVRVYVCKVNIRCWHLQHIFNNNNIHSSFFSVKEEEENFLSATYTRSVLFHNFHLVQCLNCFVCLCHDRWKKIRNILGRRSERRERDCNMLCMWYLPQIIDLSSYTNTHTHKTFFRITAKSIHRRHSDGKWTRSFPFSLSLFACFPRTHSLTHCCA